MSVRRRGRFSSLPWNAAVLAGPTLSLGRMCSRLTLHLGCHHWRSGCCRVCGAWLTDVSFGAAVAEWFRTVSGWRISPNLRVAIVLGRGSSQVTGSTGLSERDESRCEYRGRFRQESGPLLGSVPYRCLITKLKVAGVLRRVYGCY